MSLQEKIVVTLFILLSLVSFFGCGSKRPPGMPELYPCTITVTMGGLPVSGADILLTSPSIPESLVTFGKTDAQGVATVGSTYGNYFERGAPAGELTAMIQQTPDIPDELKLSNAELAKLTYEERNAYVAKTAEAVRNVPKIVPDRLTSPATSPLKVVVAESKTGTQKTFELNDYN